MAWKIRLDEDYLAWFEELEEELQDEIGASIEMLRELERRTDVWHTIWGEIPVRR